MSPDQLAIALRSFAQVQSGYARAQEGAGLGLPLARGLAREHGGAVQLETKPGTGTTAFLTLPPDAPSLAEKAAP